MLGALDRSEREPAVRDDAEEDKDEEGHDDEAEGLGSALGDELVALVLAPIVSQASLDLLLVVEGDVELLKETHELLARDRAAPVLVDGVEELVGRDGVAVGVLPHRAALQVALKHCRRDRHAVALGVELAHILGGHLVVGWHLEIAGAHAARAALFIS